MICPRFSSWRTISLWATSTATALNDEFGSLTTRAGARFIWTVFLVSADAAGAVRAVACCWGASARIRPKYGPFNKRSSANAPQKQGTMKRNALFDISLPSCVDLSLRGLTATVSGDLNLRGLLKLPGDMQ